MSEATAMWLAGVGLVELLLKVLSLTLTLDAG